MFFPVLLILIGIGAMVLADASGSTPLWRRTLDRILGVCLIAAGFGILL